MIEFTLQRSGTLQEACNREVVLNPVRRLSFRQDVLELHDGKESMQLPSASMARKIQALAARADVPPVQWHEAVSRQEKQRSQKRQHAVSDEEAGKAVAAAAAPRHALCCSRRAPWSTGQVMSSS